MHQMTLTGTAANTIAWHMRTGGGRAGMTAAGAGLTAQSRRMRLTSDTADRRRGVRVRQVRAVKILDMVAGRTAVGQTLDVSATGMKVQLSVGGTGLRVGHVFGLHVGLSRIGERLPNRRQLVPVRVVWVGPVAADGSAVAGVEFATGIGAERDAA